MTPVITPNADQDQFFKDFYQFLLDRVETEFRLTGAGGTGKTFSMEYVINEVYPRYRDACEMLGIDPIYRTVHLTATTNKAAEVLADHTGKKTSTIHQLLGLKVIFDTGTKAEKLVLKESAEFISNSLIIVDEASMLCQDGLRFLRDRTLNCKVLFVGDSYQLQPVQLTYSPVYSGPGITSELTISERNKECPELQDLCMQLRQTILDIDQGKGWDAFHPIQHIPGTIDWIQDPEVLEQELNIFQPLREQMVEDVRCIAYRNKTVQVYNEHFRWLRGMPTHFVDGEVLINNRVVELPGNTIHTDKSVTLSNVQPPRTIKLPFYVEMEVQSALLTWRNGSQVLDVPTSGEHLNEVIKYLYKMGRETGDYTPYRKAKAQYPDLRQPDALTGHKAQGSSYDHVIIDASDLTRVTHPGTFARLLYVAVSRARKRVTFYGQLSPRYGQIV